jgi:hypothetical protein
MKQKNELLRLRPFNMANFSSGAGALIFAIIFSSGIFTLPAMILVWTGFALPIKKGNGMLNFKILQRRLNRILFPICCVFFAFWIYALWDTGEIFDSFEDSIIVVLFSAYSTLGIFFAARWSAIFLFKKNKLTKSNYLIVLIISGMWIILGWIVISLALRIIAMMPYGSY